MFRTRAASILLALLIAASGLAFLRTEQLKLQHSPLQRPNVKQAFSPACAGQPRCHPQALLEFTLGDAQPVELRIVDESGDTVRSLTDGEVPHAKGRVRVRWDGRNDAGEVVPDDRYRLAVRLGDSGRTITIPAPIVVDTKAPSVAITRVDRTAKHVVVHFLPSEQTRTYQRVVFRRKLLNEHRTRRDSSMFPFKGHEPGLYEISILAVDRAGNTTPNPPTVRVRVP